MVQDSIRIIQDEHRAVAAVLRSLQLMLTRGPGDAPERFSTRAARHAVLPSTFPELHHPGVGPAVPRSWRGGRPS